MNRNHVIAYQIKKYLNQVYGGIAKTFHINTLLACTKVEL